MKRFNVEIARDERGKIEKFIILFFKSKNTRKFLGWHRSDSGICRKQIIMRNTSVLKLKKFSQNVI